MERASDHSNDIDDTPSPHGRVFCAGDNILPIWRYDDRLNPIGMSTVLCHELPALRVPESDASVRRAGRKEIAVLGVRDGVDR